MDKSLCWDLILTAKSAVRRYLGRCYIDIMAILRGVMAALKTSIACRSSELHICSNNIMVASNVSFKLKKAQVKMFLDCLTKPQRVGFNVENNCE